MRTVDLGDLTKPWDRALALARISALMAWPEDEAKRTDFLVSDAAIRLGNLSSVVSSAVDPKRALSLKRSKRTKPPKNLEALTLDLYRQLFAAFIDLGGFARVANAPAYAEQCRDAERHLKRWYTAGTLFLAIATLAKRHTDLRGGASMGKAAFLVERWWKSKLVYTSRSKIMESFASFRSVAHLCATFVLIHGVAPEVRREWSASPGNPGTWLEDFVAMGNALLGFGVKFTAKGADTPLLALDSTWRVIARPASTVARISLNPFPPAALATLATYKPNNRDI